MPKIQPLRASDPREIGGFALQGLIGEGGQGIVFLGVSEAGQRAAVKLLHARLDDDARRYLHRELAALLRVAPFCTAQVLAADPDADPPFVVSEFINGPSLQEAVGEHGVLRGTALDRLAIGTATALRAIHAAGVVHRDLKPANVLVAADGPRVIDFGIARALNATAATVSGAVGTPAYMSPEQLSGHAVGPPVDMFAWACTVVYAAVGRPPFGQAPLPAVIARILNAPPDLGPITGRLREVVAACLDKDPSRRPTAAQVLHELTGEAPGGPTIARQGPAADGPRLRMAVAAAVAAVIIGAVGVAAVVNGPFARGAPPGGPSASPTASSSSPLPELSRSPRLGLEFWQNQHAAQMSFRDRDTPVVGVSLDPAPFEVRLPRLPEGRALQICAWTDDSIFSITDGAAINDHPCLGAGRGIADYEHGSGTLHVSNEGHNYLIDTRLARHSDEHAKAEFHTTTRDGTTTSLAKQRDNIYLTVLVDRNGDGAFKRAGRGEYEYLVLEFGAA